MEAVYFGFWSRSIDHRLSAFSLYFTIFTSHPLCLHLQYQRNKHLPNIIMSTRSRLSARAQNSSRNSSNSSTLNTSRVLSTSARDRSLLYESMTHRSNDNGSRT